MRSRDSEGGKKQAIHRSGRTAAILALGLILVATLWPHPPREDSIPFFCLTCRSQALGDAIVNVALFVPLGIGLVLAGAPVWAAAAAGLATTIGVEGLQVNVIPGRDSSFGDVLANTTGTLLGALAARHAAVILFPAKGRAPFWATLTGAGAALVLFVTAWLLGFRLPEATWYGQWAPHLGQYERFHGAVHGAELNGLPLPRGRLGDTPARMTRIREDGEVLLQARFTPAGPTPDLAPIVSVFDEHHRKVLLLGQKGGRFQFEVRTRAEAFAFRSPATTLLADGLVEGTPVEASGLADRRGMHLYLSQGDLRWQARTQHSADVGWLFLSPFAPPTSGFLIGLLGALWVGGLWVPWGYYWRRARIRQAGVQSLFARGEWLAVLAPLPVFAVACLVGWGTVGPAAALLAGPIGALAGSFLADHVVPADHPD